ncbi:hypothetical protein KQX54_009268 [Cotesia glomerata]|uniref:SCP domain-containing protein n=1 Tax=Cotesia glomerata TaxID=32391 RepID=A0AAV7J2A9_COTGL|nr:hypothetical protein KQX54_009268 [Cotesia glomerata]
MLSASCDEVHWQNSSGIKKVTMRLLWTFVIMIAALPAALPWETDRSKPMPRLYGDKIPTRVLTPSNKKVQRKIVLYHNFFRTHVTPTAANMLVMKWHTGAAKAAQRWAEACYALTHDNATGLHIDAFGSCGQNIFISTAQVPCLNSGIEMQRKVVEVLREQRLAPDDQTEHLAQVSGSKF